MKIDTSLIKVVTPPYASDPNRLNPAISQKLEETVSGLVLAYIESGRELAVLSGMSVRFRAVCLDLVNAAATGAASAVSRHFQSPEDLREIINQLYAAIDDMVGVWKILEKNG